MGDEGNIRVLLAQIEAKIDVALTQHGAEIAEHGRRLNRQGSEIDGIGERTRSIESRITAQETALKAVVDTSRSRNPTAWAAVAVSLIVLLLSIAKDLYT